MFDFTGVRFCFSVVAGVAERIRWSFLKGEEAFDVGDATWSVKLSGVADGVRQEVPGAEVFHGSRLGELVLHVPSLEAGQYDYEIVAVSSAGDVDRVLYGVLTVLASQQLAGVEAEAAAASVRQMRVLVPSVAGAPLRLAWLGSSLGAALVGEVKQAAGQAHESLSALVQEAAGQAERAEAAAADAQGALQDASVAVGKLEVVQAFIACFEDKVVSVVRVDPESGHLVIGGVDTMVKVSGEPGRSPYIAQNGRWRYFDDASQQWMEGPPARGEAGKSPYVDADGYVVDVNPLTGEYRRTDICVRGRDGLDGTSVVRHVIGGKEDLPLSGDTCNGGHYYYVPLCDALPVAVFEPQEGRSQTGGISVNGVSVVLPGTELEPVEAAERLAELLREAFPEAEVETRDAAVALRGDVQAWTVSGLDEGEWRLTLHVRMPRKGYDVYAWLVRQDGHAGWVCVGEANDIATAEIYGLTKLSTDVPVEGGAPVGVDKQGGMRVPHAGYTVPGTVLPAVDFVLSQGGGVGFDADGRMFCRMASVDVLGAVKPSFSGSNLAAVVGLFADGSMGVPWGSWSQGGVFRAGSQFGQSNPIPYIVGVGVTASHELANNLVYSGAIQHMKPADWVSKGMSWLVEAMDGHPEFFTDMFYCGLVTSEQFAQGQERGLELVSATGDLMAGVYLALSMSDARSNAVPCAQVVHSWVVGYAYSRAEVYRKEEVDGKDAALQAGINQLRQDVADTYLTKGTAAQVYETQVDAGSAYRELQEGIDGCVKRRKNWNGSDFLTQAEYLALSPSEIDPLVEYNILEDEV